MGMFGGATDVLMRMDKNFFLRSPLMARTLYVPHRTSSIPRFRRYMHFLQLSSEVVIVMRRWFTVGGTATIALRCGLRRLLVVACYLV